MAFATEVSVVAACPCAVGGCTSTVGVCTCGGPSGENMTILSDDVRSASNLFSAWRHVKRSALNSKNTKIRGHAGEFEYNHQRHLKTIATQLRENRFNFDGVEGVLKDKKKRESAGKDPRPIAVASIKNRIVQRAILQVLQPRKAVNKRDINTRYTPKEDPRLGNLNQINCSKFGVGGLMSPYGGVRPAITLIMKAMSGGASYYYQSDIKAYFTKIPTARVVDKVFVETDDKNLVDLFARGLEVNLANKDELLSYAKIFPSGGIGVAQGSSLSAFAGNVLLYDFDHDLNRLGVTAVRYIDDLLLVSHSKEILKKAVAFSEDHLGSFGFSLYPPVPGSDKASQGECNNAFNFLGCTVQPNRCVPSKQSIAKLNADVNRTMSASKKGINELLSKGTPLDSKLSKSTILHDLGKKIYGWQKSFAFCTDSQAFRRLDSDIVLRVSNYEGWIHNKTRSLLAEERMQIIGIPSTEKLFETDTGRGRSRVTSSTQGLSP